MIFVGISSQTKAQVQTHRSDQYVVATAGKSTDTARVVTSRDANGRPNGWGDALFVLEWSAGEAIIEQIRGSKKFITQGYHQFLGSNPALVPRSDFVFSKLDQEGIKQHFSVFPNPFVNNLSVNWEFSEDIKLVFEIYSIDGRRVFYRNETAKNSQLFLQLNNLPSQIYILRVSDPARGFLETHKIIKL